MSDIFKKQLCLFNHFLSRAEFFLVVSSLSEMSYCFYSKFTVTFTAKCRVTVTPFPASVTEETQCSPSGATFCVQALVHIGYTSLDAVMNLV